MATTTTTLTKGNISVEFKLSCAAGDEKGITVEADDTLNADCIRYSELFHFKVYTWNLPKGYTIYTSDNSINVVSGGVKNETKEQSITFANEDTASLSYPIDALGAMTWYGNQLGSPLQVSATEVKIPKAGVGAGTLTFTTHHNAHSFTVVAPASPPEVYPVVVLIQENP
ncbi:hypothetical protein MBAV_002593 [Candidatus Magnetobacterium bavaricum]|uniref:Uncharacterized protein n=1 Tax=Candidatus Magnetobacterium bavaricum TaxID=29290 RepID=A0A0F3GTN6_9BACT|nr:hypothetical protein MBAV_002593 [Candidatus Magnetobacterium bavaricum]